MAADTTAAAASTSVPALWWIAPISAIVALIAAYLFYRGMVASDPGTPVMQGIAKDVRDGAMAYLKRQYKVLLVFFIVIAAILAAMAFVLKAQHPLVPVGFVTAGFFSGLCGFLGMWTATRASNRTAAACSREADGLNAGLRVAFRSGAVMGLVVVGFALLDICVWFLLLEYGVLGAFSPEEISVIMLSFGMGASAQALFARVGGGIYTKAADVGADLVGKVEAGIPEDDPRNPATIADNVGDNVGDVAGMGADLYESYYGSILASAALGASAVPFVPDLAKNLYANQINLMALPAILAGAGILLSLLGVFLVRTKPDAKFGDLMSALHRPLLIVGLLFAAATFGLVYALLGQAYLGVAASVVVGLVAGIWIGNRTEHYTSYDAAPTQGVSRQAEYGPATVIIDGIATGMWSTAWPVVTIGVAIILAYGFAGGFVHPVLGLYGIGLAAVGMLATLGYTLATDAYGPIADNAGGNAEMAGLPPHTRNNTDALDSLGNTTAATGKGFAIGSAALTAMALIAAYFGVVRTSLDRVGMSIVEHTAEAEVPAALAKVGLTRLANGQLALNIGGDSADEIAASVHVVPLANATFENFMDFYHINLMNPVVLVCLFVGAMLAFAFCAITMKAVGRAAASMVAEVRRQFREIPGIMQYKPGDDSPENLARRPHYADCVTISTRGAQAEMVLPSVMAVVAPVLVGMIFGVAGVVGLLAGALSTGFVLAVMMANAGGSWDNAKKYIEQRGKLTMAELWSDKDADVAKVKVAEEKLGITTDEARLRVRFSRGNPARKLENGLTVAELWADPAKLREALQAQPELWDTRPWMIVDGKGSAAHAAGVVGDTVGDPFKDTSGPSLNILIKLMAMVSVVFAGLTAAYGSQFLELWRGLFMGG
ncbi:MAG: sodium-translocating pyrophosphatase [Planctomycetota bacterium]